MAVLNRLPIHRLYVVIFTFSGSLGLQDSQHFQSGARRRKGCRIGQTIKPSLLFSPFGRRDVPVGVPLNLSTPTGMGCIGTYGENCKSVNVSKYRVLLVMA